MGSGVRALASGLPGPLLFSDQLSAVRKHVREIRVIAAHRKAILVNLSGGKFRAQFSSFQTDVYSL
jgi:hypothetical protein